MTKSKKKRFYETYMLVCLRRDWMGDLLGLLLDTYLHLGVADRHFILLLL